MTDSLPIRCLKCNAVLSENQLGGLCPDCLGRKMFGERTTAGSSGSTSDDASILCGEAASGESLAEIDPGRMIGRYRLLERIGEGGFGVVFRAEQVEPVKRTVALKIIKLGMDTEQVVARFDAERQALAMMDHPNIARVLDGGATASGRPYFVMELVSGIPITEYCDTHKCTTAERLELFVTVCRAIQHAHHKGIIHRDIKPSNILVSPAPMESVGAVASQGIPKVIDFGIAKATQMELTEQTVFTGLNQFLGTPVYMSPEQLEVSAADVDTRSDIYSLGVLLYQLLTGRTPFESQVLHKSSLDEMLRVIRETDPPRPSTRVSTLPDQERSNLARQLGTTPHKLAHQLRGDLDWIVMKCLEKDRARRYETANGLARDIERHLYSEPVTACPPSMAYRTCKFVRRYRLAVLAITAVSISLLVGIVLTSLGFIQAKRQGKRADREAQTALTMSYGAYLRSAIYLNDSVGNGGRAREALDNCPIEMRDWEWHYLYSKCDQTHRLVAQGLDGVRKAVFTPDGSMVMVWGSDGLYQVLDVHSGLEMGRFQMKLLPPDTWRYRLVTAHGPSFMPDGKRVVLLDSSQIAIWDLSTGALLQTMTHQRPMAVYADSEALLGLGRQAEGSADVVIWDLAANQVHSSISSPPESTYGGRFTPDGKGLMLFGGFGTMKGSTTWVDFCDLSSGLPVRRIVTAHHFPMYDVAFNQDHQLLATVSTDTFAKVFDLDRPDANTPVHTFQAGAALWAVALSHDGRRLAAGGTGSDILIWDLSSEPNEAEPTRLTGHASKIQSLCFSPDDQWLLSSSLDGTVRLWESRPYKTAHFYFVQQLAKDVVFSPDGARLVSVGRQGVVKLWDAVTGQELATLGEVGVPIQQVAYSPDGSTLAMLESVSGRVSLRDTSSWQQRLTLPELPSSVAGIQFVGEALAGYDTDNRVYFWNAKDGTLDAQFSLGESAVNPTAFAFSTDGSLLAVSLSNTKNEVHLYDVATGKIRLQLAGPNSTVNSLAFSPYGRRLAAGSADTTALVWALPSGHLTHRLQGHTEPVKTVVFSPSGQRLLTGSADDSLRIWKLDTAEELFSLPIPDGGNIDLIRFSPDGRTIMAINTFYPPWFFQSFLPSSEVRRAHRIIRLAYYKVWRLTQELRSPQRVLEALRQDIELEPEVKKMAIDIVMTRRGADASQTPAVTSPTIHPPSENND